MGLPSSPCIKWCFSSSWTNSLGWSRFSLSLTQPEIYIFSWNWEFKKKYFFFREIENSKEIIFFSWNWNLNFFFLVKLKIQREILKNSWNWKLLFLPDGADTSLLEASMLLMVVSCKSSRPEMPEAICALLFFLLKIKMKKLVKLHNEKWENVDKKEWIHTLFRNKSRFMLDEMFQKNASKFAIFLKYFILFLNVDIDQGIH